MRSTWVLIILVISSAFGAGVLSLWAWRTPRNQVDYSEIMRLRKQFTESHAPVGEFDLEVLFPGSNRRERIEPGLPSSASFAYAEISRLYRYAQSCDSKQAGARVSRELEKAWLWHRWICPGAASPLARGFFEKGPRLHPSGSSFAFLAWKSGRPEFQDAGWLSSHQASMNLSELAQLPGESLPSGMKLAALLGRSARQALAQESPVIWGDPYFLVRDATRVDTGQVSYRVYRLEELQRFLADRPVILTEYRSGMSCVLREGNSCWRYDLDRLTQRGRRSALIFSLSVLFLSFIVGWVLIGDSRRQKFEEDRKRFALQTLTHELRTPIAGLVLGADAVRARFGEIPDSLQTPFLRMMDDIQRLLRLADASRQYLSAATHKIDLRPVALESAKQWLGDLAHDVDPQIEVHVASDFGFSADPYWTAICITNLLKNAVTHGAFPVTLEAGSSGGQVEISVIDRGSTQTTNTLRAGNRGLGLGLSIVREIASEMGGSLRHRESPTCYTLRFPSRGTV